MKIGYAIISVDDSRLATKSSLHKQMKDYDDVSDQIQFVDGRIDGTIEKYIADNNVRVVDGNFHYGELGVWFSNINAWKYIAESDYDAVIVFEDDAVILPLFHEMMKRVQEDLPKDFDFMSLLVPRNQVYDYHYHRKHFAGGGWELLSQHRYTLTDSPHYIGSKYIATAYQGYSNVAVMYSKVGAQKILARIDEAGVYTPVDCFIYAEHFMNELNGYTFMPVTTPVITFIEQGTIARATGMFA